MTQRLDQLLASLGYGSRREVKELVKARRVSVAGAIARDPGQKVDAACVRLDGEPLADPGPLCILLHKPAGVVCSHDQREGARVYDLLPPRWLRRNPPPTTVGRLDKDTTGALLITDVAAIVQRLTSPRHKVRKLYRARLDRPAQPEWVDTFASGTLLLSGDDKPCAPAELRILQDPCEIELTLTEGRYHQVKRMFAAHGAMVEALHRVAFGGLSADHLPPGQWQAIALDHPGLSA